MNDTESATLVWKQIKPRELKEKLDQNPALVVVDVRTTPEFQQGHLAQAQLLPLDDLQPAEVRHRFNVNPHSEIVLVCQSGKRAKKAAQRLAAAGFSNLEVLTGGTAGWIESGQRVTREKTQTLPLIRQVQLAVGLVSFTGSVLALTINVYFAVIPAITGLGLTIAGTTGWCGLALLLAKMPWNKVLCADNA